MKITDSEFKRLVDYIQSNYGINLSRKRVLVEGRLSNIIKEKGFSSFNEYFNYVFSEKSGKEAVTLINKLTTNHTYFMRESQHFDFLKSVALPQIEKNIRDRDVRIWCAASSTGQEPYTIAMTIDDYFRDRKRGWDLRILATDIDTNVLQKAKNGIYPAESLESLPTGWKEKYFVKENDDAYRVVDRIKNEVIFKQFNLMDKIVYKKPYDIIFCRNVMIYFDNETKFNLIERFYDASKNGAYLFVGLAENVPKTSRYRFVKPAIYQKIESR